jgi:hypothetical protein
MMMSTIFTSQRGEPVTDAMLKAAQGIGAEHGLEVTEQQARTVLDVGLPYSMLGVPAAAEAAKIEEWMTDVMLDSAIAAID